MVIRQQTLGLHHDDYEVGPPFRGPSFHRPHQLFTPVRFVAHSLQIVLTIAFLADSMAFTLHYCDFGKPSGHGCLSRVFEGWLKARVIRFLGLDTLV